MEFNIETATMADLWAAKAYSDEQFDIWFESGKTEKGGKDETADVCMDYHDTVSDIIENEIGRRLESAFPPPFER